MLSAALFANRDNALEERRRHRQVCDFIAGMTDRYAIALYTQLFMPRP